MGQPKTRPCTVYAIQCTESKRVYIGLTQDFETRIVTHFRELKRGEKKTTKRIPGCAVGPRLTDWQEDYNKYGEDAFKVYKLEENVPSKMAYDREKYWIDYYGSSNPKYGYNMQRGGQTPDMISITPGMPEKVAP